MKKHIKTSFAIAAAILFMHGPVHAQLAKQGLTMREISRAVNELAGKKDDASKVQLRKEAEALANAENEAYNALAARIYQLLGEKEIAEKITSELIKKYPNGTRARNAAMQNIFEDNDNTLDQRIDAYRSWLKNFPATSIEGNERYVYSTAATRIGNQMVEENRIDDAVALAQEHAGTPEYHRVLSAIAGNLNDQGHYAAALALLEEAARDIEKEEVRSRTHNAVLRQYAQALVNTGKPEEAIKLAQSLIERSGRYINAEDVLIVAKGYEKLDRELDAFKKLENFLINNTINSQIAAAIEPLYNKLNNNKGDYISYKEGLHTQIKEAQKARYKSQMIERDAPAFSLTNMQGDTVSLEDFRGKIVILDFWATWCGPCIMSFPGMQAAVNKYKEDPEVEFLFINTWQSEENYKELVTDFIAEHNYTFHVLYDEMKNREKAAVTAYEVRGIPTKVFIDQQGKIRFLSAGGSADVAVVVGEMDAKIELIKEATKGAQ